MTIGRAIWPSIMASATDLPITEHLSVPVNDAGLHGSFKAGKLSRYRIRTGPVPGVGSG